MHEAPPYSEGMTSSTQPSAPGDAADFCALDELADTWKTVVRGYTHVTEMLTEQVERETGLPGVEFLALVWLLRGDSGGRDASDVAVPLSKLARQVAFSSGGFTKVADRLEQAGLIKRQPSSSDRRVTHAVLTDSGRALAQALYDKFAQALAVDGEGAFGQGPAGTGEHGVGHPAVRG